MSGWRPFPHFSWDLRACGRGTRPTRRTTRAAPAAARRDADRRGLAVPALRRLRARSGRGQRSRGRRTDRPARASVADAFILRLLAVERAVRGVLLLAAGLWLHRFSGAQGSLQKVFEQDLPLLKPLADRFGVDLETSGPVKLIREAFGVRRTPSSCSRWVSRRTARSNCSKRWAPGCCAAGASTSRSWVRRSSCRWRSASCSTGSPSCACWPSDQRGCRGLPALDQAPVRSPGGRAAFEAERHSESLLEVEAAALS